MKRTRHALRLATGLLLLATSGPLFADPALGKTDDRHDNYRSESDQGGWSRGPAPVKLPDRNRADRRPLGTSRDDYHERFDDAPPHRGNYRKQYDSDRYGHDARRAADAVRRDERGRVLSSEPTDDRGYRVRVLTPDGYVRERYVDPRDEHGDYSDQRRRSNRQRRRD